MTTESWFNDVWRPIETSVEQERVFALVDNAGINDLPSKLRQHPSLSSINLFEGSKEANALVVAPILIDLGTVNESTSVSKFFFRWLATQCATTNALLVMRTSWSHRSLANALKRRLDATLPDDMQVLLRYFDTRVFEALMTVLDAQQKVAFCGLAKHWWWLNRAGVPQSLRTDEHDRDNVPHPLVLNDTQQARLIDACEPDAVAHELRRLASDLCMGRLHAQVHELISTCLPAAESYGITTFSMKVMFCVIALERGANFHKQPQWNELLRTAQLQGRDLNWVIQQADM